MIYKNHKVTISVNNNFLELSDQTSLNLRLNNVIYDPTKLTNVQSEYSFTFSIPNTPINNKIFDFANILSKKNKFNKLYSAIVYGDGNEIFRGQLKIAEITTESYKCNLVSVKVNKIEDIFGESKMNEIVWYTPYEGMNTIQEINAQLTSDYYYPLVCYGVFQKLPSATYSNEYNAYTSKYLLDKYVQWYDESLSPSVRLIPLIKKMFEQKGYAVSGDIFEDDIANDIYLSTHLGDKQIPTYNLGSDLGKIECDFKMWTGATWEYKNADGRVYSSGSTSVGATGANLTYKHEFAGYDHYNFDQILVYDVFKTASKFRGTSIDQRPASALLWGQEFTQNNDNMYRDGYIQIPADGAYKIELEVEVDISDNKAQPGALIWNTSNAQEQKTISHSWEGMPVEIQLVRNSTDTDIELIYGYDGKVQSVWPHEAPNTAATNTTGTRPSSTTRPTTSGSTSGNRGRHSIEPYPIYESDPENPTAEDYNMGFMPKQGFLLCYDQWANPNFITGFSTIGNCPSVIKNGYSWNSEVTSEIHSRYDCGGYYGVNYTEDGEYVWKSTSWNSNNYPGSPMDMVQDSGAFKKKGKVTCVVWLNRNDLISLKLIKRKYEGGTYIESEWPNRERQYYVNYNVVTTGKIKIEAYSPNVGDLTSSDLRYNTPVKFDTQLNLGQFLNKDVKQSDFVNNFIKAFNLSFVQSNNTVSLNKNYIDFTRMLIPINLDNRVYNKNITIQPIDYPSTMRINYSINDEEAGFYNSVPKDRLNYDDWKDYADVGSEKILLTMNEDATDLTQTLTNSYTWYSPFKVNIYGDDGKITEVKTIQLPIIIKDEWMIENYKYEESMQVDGKSLAQRWWFRQPINYDIQFETVNNEFFNPSIPTNTKNGITLNYMNDDNTLLTKYFNITAYTSSDMIEFETYLTPDEYSLIKKGSPIQINSDIYYTCSITGYDPTGNNTTKIKAMKKA